MDFLGTDIPVSKYIFGNKVGYSIRSDGIDRYELILLAIPAQWYRHLRL